MKQNLKIEKEVGDMEKKKHFSTATVEEALTLTGKGTFSNCIDQNQY